MEFVEAPIISGFLMAEPTLLTAEPIAKAQADGSGPIHRYRFVVL
jgi:hypothetical protein